MMGCKKDALSYEEAYHIGNDLHERMYQAMPARIVNFFLGKGTLGKLKEVAEGPPMAGLNKSSE